MKRIYPMSLAPWSPRRFPTRRPFSPSILMQNEPKASGQSDLAAHEAQDDFLRFKRLIRHEKVTGALVGSVVALILSPISLFLAFSLNQSFSSADLSVEYVELVVEEKPIPLPIDSLNELMGSDGFRVGLLRNAAPFASLMQFRQPGRSASGSEMREIRNALSSFATFTRERLELLRSLQDALTNHITESRVRELSSQYVGPTPQYVANQGDLESVRSSLAAQITTERDALLNSSRQSQRLMDKLGQARSEGIGSVHLKLSILNRGNTDGLVRSRAEVRFPQDRLAFPLRRSSPQKKGDPNMALAVPVSVINGNDDAQRGGAVGKVDKNSMVEFWFALDQETMSPDEFMNATSLLARGATNTFDLVLIDHKNDQIHYRKERERPKATTQASTLP